jgi:hypothetical protein
MDEEHETEETGNQVRTEWGFKNVAKVEDGADDGPDHGYSADPAWQDLRPQDRTAEGRDRQTCEHHVVPLDS